MTREPRVAAGADDRKRPRCQPFLLWLRTWTRLSPYKAERPTESAAGYHSDLIDWLLQDTLKMKSTRGCRYGKQETTRTSPSPSTRLPPPNPLDRFTSHGKGGKPQSSLHQPEQARPSPTGVHHHLSSKSIPDGPVQCLGHYGQDQPICTQPGQLNNHT